MHSSNYIFLINPTCRAMVVNYDPDKPSEERIVKTLDPNIQKDDLVVVPATTRHEFTVCRVVEADVDIDFERNIKVDWIVHKVDQESYKKMVEEENFAVQKIRSAEIRQKREELSEKLLKNRQEELGEFSIVTARIEGPKQEPPATDGGAAST